MTDSFWWILFSLFIYGVMHSIFASLRFKSWVKGRIGEGRFNRFYRLFFSIQAGVLFLPVLILSAILPNQPLYQISRPWIFLSLAIQFLAAAALVHTVMLTGAMRFVGFQQAVNPHSATQRLPLVKQGLYRFVRHPLYTCSLLIIWLLPTMSWNTLALNIGITLYMLIGAVFEEQKLVHEFGEDYQAYRKETAFIIPGIKFL